MATCPLFDTNPLIKQKRTEIAPFPATQGRFLPTWLLFVNLLSSFQDESRYGGEMFPLFWHLFSAIFLRFLSFLSSLCSLKHSSFVVVSLCSWNPVLGVSCPLKVFPLSLSLSLSLVFFFFLVSFYHFSCFYFFSSSNFFLHLSKKQIHFPVISRIPTFTLPSSWFWVKRCSCNCIGGLVPSLVHYISMNDVVYVIDIWLLHIVSACIYYPLLAVNSRKKMFTGCILA